MPANVVKELGPDSNLFPKAFEERSQLLGEHSILVRKPALEVIAFLQQLDWQNRMAPKFVLWGQPGDLNGVLRPITFHFSLIVQILIQLSIYQL